jgi:hypothetical protein
LLSCTHPPVALVDFNDNKGHTCAVEALPSRQLYSTTGRPSIAPERLLRASLVMALFSVRSERQSIVRMRRLIPIEAMASQGRRVSEAMKTASGGKTSTAVPRPKRAKNAKKRQQTSNGSGDQVFLRNL